MNKPRIAFVTSTFPGRNDPSIGFFNYLAMKSISDDFDVHVYKLRLWRPFRPLYRRTAFEEIPVTEVFIPALPGLRTLYKFIFVWTGYLLLKRKIGPGYTLIYSSFFTLSGLICALISHRCKIVHVATVVGSDVNFDLPRYLKFNIGNYFCRGTHTVITLSKCLSRRLRSLLPAMHNVEVLYRGVDLVKFNPPCYEVNPDSTQFLFMGGFPDGLGDDGINLKGGMTILEIWEQEEERFNRLNFSLLVVGHQTSRAAVLRWHKRLRYPGRVVIRGTVNQNEAIAIIRQADIVLMPSLAEGLPNVAMESAALGRTVICSDAGGLPEIVQHGVSGIIIPSHNKQALLDAMLETAGRKEKLRQYGQAARKIVEREFDNRNFNLRVKKVLQQAIAGQVCHN